MRTWSDSNWRRGCSISSDQTITRLIWLLENRELLSTTGAVANGRPPGLLASAPEFGGGSPGDLETAIEDMFSHVTDGQTVRPFFITSPRAALWAALQRTDTGARFPNGRIDGGDIAGIPLLTSAAAANKLILVDAAKLLVVDEGLETTGSRNTGRQPRMTTERDCSPLTHPEMK